MKTAYPSRGYYLGACLWVLSLQYYITQVVVAASWSKDHGYNWANNTISDLGNTRCGVYGSRLVCSPLHTYMNISFIVLGITMAVGAYLLRKLLKGSSLCKFGLSFMALAGVGTVLVGLFPENTISELHIIGAALPFTLGNLAMIMVGFALKPMPIILRVYSILSGLIALVALVLFMEDVYLGIGIGGMERFVGYPQSIWMIVFGSYLLVKRYRKV
jgi:hypothetical membrane protein